MKNDDYETIIRRPSAEVLPPSTPIEPGKKSSHFYTHSAKPQENNHANLVLALGILSLFMCGPLGIIAWLVANSDLKKIRRGEMSSKKVSIVRLGRTLGIIGTIFFVVSAALATFLFYRGVSNLGDILKKDALKPNELVFVGEWLGKRGTFIKIWPDGRGDFSTANSSITGGRVSIENSSLRIGIFGFSKDWHIDKRPYLENGNWMMQLDGEIFIRKGNGHTV